MSDRRRIHMRWWETRVATWVTMIFLMLGSIAGTLIGIVLAQAVLAPDSPQWITP